MLPFNTDALWHKSKPSNHYQAKKSSFQVFQKPFQPTILTLKKESIVRFWLTGFSLFFISRPISSAVVFAKNLEAKKYNHGFKRKQGKDEISTLNNALISLSSNLENLEKQNELLLHFTPKTLIVLST